MAAEGFASRTFQKTGKIADLAPSATSAAGNMYDLICRMNRSLGEVCGYGLVAMVLFLVAELASRIIGHPIQGGSILAVFVMVAAIYLGLATCEERQKHIKMDAVIPMLPWRAQKWVAVFNYVVLIVLFAAVFFAVSRSAIDSFSVGEAESVGSSTIVIWPVKLAMALGILCYWLQLVANLYGFVRYFGTSPVLKQCVDPHVEVVDAAGTPARRGSTEL